MKYSKLAPLFALFLFASPVFSQEKKADCQDVVYLKEGSILRGKITEYKIDGDLAITTWSGVQMRIPAVNVKKMVQKCKEEKPAPLSLPYSFKETGWYHASRISFLPGGSGLGFSVQHSSGLKFNQWLGAGIGAGFENFDPFSTDAATFPIFAELRGYLMKKNISPFYALGAGYGISNKVNSTNVYVDGPEERWQGGWMAQGQIGYRIGNHAFIHLGIRLQHKTRHSSNPWSNVTTVDQILHKRLDLGFGILL